MKKFTLKKKKKRFQIKEQKKINLKLKLKPKMAEDIWFVQKQFSFANKNYLNIFCFFLVSQYIFWSVVVCGG